MPSKASEFSHPDILIGLSILSYRHEGLRREDLRSVIHDLRTRLVSQIGPIRNRPASRQFAEWVELAGKRVRGTVRDYHNHITFPEPEQVRRPLR